MANVFVSRTGYKASTVLASVEVMRVLIMNANGNVTIQTKNYPHPNDPDGVTEEVRLYCEKCQASKQFEFNVMFDESRLIQELEWAKRHTHTDGKTLIVVQDEVNTPKLESDRKLKVVK
jgi:hypothetical protein